jgi:hypothetical protein
MGRVGTARLIADPNQDHRLPQAKRYFSFFNAAMAFA